MTDLTLEQAQLFRMLTGFFGQDRIILNMSVLAVCGGELPAPVYPSDEQPRSLPADLGAWAKGNRCLFTVIDSDDSPKMVLDFEALDSSAGGHGTVDPEKIEYLITEKTKAIIPVHEFGLACNISEVISIALTNKIHVIEDAACALGAKENEQPVGSFGIVASFSLHPRKSVTSGEGGIITTNNQELAAKFRALRNHGIDSENTDSMEFILAGYNYRLTDFQAAFVNSQLERFDQILTQKQMLADVYLNELDASVMKLPVVPDGKNHTWQTFHVEIGRASCRERV